MRKSRRWLARLSDSEWHRTDYSATGGHDRLKMQLLPEELDQFHAKKRVAKIVKLVPSSPARLTFRCCCFSRIPLADISIPTHSVWRPLNNVVQNTPLLFCDRRTVPKKDLIEVDKVLSDKVEKSYFMFYQDYHGWYYLSEQRSDEVAVFPTWTSMPEGDFAGTFSPPFRPHQDHMLFGSLTDLDLDV